MLKCKHCGTTTDSKGKPFMHKGSLNLHQSMHCKMRPAASSTADTDYCCDNPQLRLLKRGHHEEQLMLDFGYKTVCTNCAEVQ